jgi:kynurenine formamidase
MPHASPPPHATRLSRHQLIADGDVCNQATLNLDAHTGTHVDAPLHFVTDGAGIESLDLSVLIGPALVVALPEGTNITGAVRARCNRSGNRTATLLPTHCPQRTHWSGCSCPSMRRVCSSRPTTAKSE